MPNDCLVTKLKGTINNNSLPKLGILRFNVNAQVSTDSALTNMCYLGVAVDVKIVSGSITLIDNHNTQYTTDITNKILYYVRGTGVIEVSNKYGCTDIRLGQMILPDFNVIDNIKYMGSLGRLNIYSSNINQDISDPDAQISTLTGLILQGSTIKGNIKDYVHTYPNLTQLQLLSTVITGSVSEIGKLLSLTSLVLGYSFRTQSIEDIVHAYRENGKTENSTGISILTTEIKFNGQTVSYSATTRNLTWTASTITFDGTTINS